MGILEETEEVPEGPSEYELARLEKIKRNAMVMASLGLSSMAGEMRSTVNLEAAEKARARGLKRPAKKAEKPKLERTRCVLSFFFDGWRTYMTEPGRASKRSLIRKPAR